MNSDKQPFMSIADLTDDTLIDTGTEIVRWGDLCKMFERDQEGFASES